MQELKSNFSSQEINYREKMELVSLLDAEKEDDLQTRQGRLHEAAMKGTVSSLLQILQEDPLILNSTFSSLPDTPLSTSVLLGHLEFSKILLNRKPELAKLLNSHGSSALHLASAKGNVEIVKELLLVNPEMCFVLDHDGRSPLHLAAIKGRAAVLTELIQAKSEAAQVLTGGGETCLHLCVSYNRLEALKIFVERLKQDDQLMNWKDQNGNTILHLAVAKKQIEIVKYLMTNTGVDVHSRNANGLTALELLSQNPGDLRDMEIRQCLQHGRASKIEHMPSFLPETDVPQSASTVQKQNLQNSSTKKQLNKHKHTDWLGRKRSAIMVVASLLATVAFQAGLSPPGGVWQDDLMVDSKGNPEEKPHKAGQSVMAINLPEAYGQFMIFNTIAFLASLSIILVQVSGLPMKQRRWMWTQMVTLWIAITAQTITYFITFINLTPNRNEKGTLYHVTKISVLAWLSLMAVVFTGNVVRVALYFLRKYGYVKEKERGPSLYVEDEENDEL